MITKMKRTLVLLIMVLYMSVFIVMLQRNTKEMKTRITNTTIRTNYKASSSDYFRGKTCPKTFGRIALVSVMTAGNYVNNDVNNAMQSLRCYAELRGYDLYQIQEKSDGNFTGLKGWTVPEQCLQKDVALMKKRHCFMAHLLYHYDYAIHLDADTGVINPKHCFEEYITPGIDVFLLERVHSGEIQSGHYIVKNTTYARDFLMESYNLMIKPKKVENTELVYAFHSRVVSIEDRNKCPQSLPYFTYVRCIKKVMNGQMVFKNVKVYRRAHGFVRDAWTSNFTWSDNDFLLHAMKYRDDVLFTKKLTPQDCSNSTWLPIKKSLFANIDTMKSIWRKADKSFPNNKLGIEKSDIANCWPRCSENITELLK